ncbi:hypothetical protein OIU74_004097, partial [Salix koriyanagi]
MFLAVLDNLSKNLGHNGKEIKTLTLDYSRERYLTEELF